jgi:hypothetical protein
VQELNKYLTRINNKGALRADGKELKSHIQRIILNIFSIKALLLSLKKIGAKNF